MIGLHDADSTSFPNLALMKLSAHFNTKGKDVELWKPEHFYESVFSSKVFTFTKESASEGAILGGYGRGIVQTLPEEIEHSCPDYSLYGIDYSMGFLTRGCPNKCSWCFVPQKEGDIRAHADLSEFVRHKEVVFLDNNVLAHDHGINQIKKSGELGLKIDFNQGLDPRRIDDTIARYLSQCKWRSPVRLACDTDSAMESVRKAVELLRWHNVTPRAYFCYVLVKDIPSALERVRFLKGLGVDPFAQPYIPQDGTPPTRLQRRFARWVNLKQLFKSIGWEEYQLMQGENI